MEPQSENTQSTSSEPVNSEYPSSDQPTVQDDDSSKPTHIKLGIFLAMAFLWAITIYFFGHEFTASPPWLVLLGTALFSIPIILSGLYLSTVKKIRILAGFSRRGWLHKFFSGRIISILLWSIWAPITTFFLLIQFHAYSIWEWGAFFLVIPLFWIVYQISRMVIGSEMKPYLVSAVALKAARLITPVIAFIIYLATLFYFADVPQFELLSDAIDANKLIANKTPGSAVVFEFAQWQAYYDGAKGFALSKLGEIEASLALLMFSLGGIIVFFNACSMLSCFMIPRCEYRRLFSPLSETSTPEQIEPWRVAISTGIITFVLLFVALPTFSQLENLALNNNDSFAGTRQKTYAMVTKIEGEYYKPTTLQEIQKIQSEIIKKSSKLHPELKREINHAFDKMESNVDAYLDWYYSLSAEYLRTINLLMGNAEAYISNKLEDHLKRGEPFKNFEAKLKEVIALQETVKKQYEDKIKGLLADNKLDIQKGTNITVVGEASLSEILEPPKGTLDIEKRVGTASAAGGVAGVATAVVVKKIITKASTKGALKTAAKAITKMVGSKVASSAGGAAAGAATGAAIGSIVPGFGTAIGAVVGALGGIVVGITVDKGMLMLEETINREDFKRDILLGINNARTEFMEQLNLE